MHFFSVLPVARAMQMGQPVRKQHLITTFNIIIMSLRSRILEYINQHTGGVKISDMEKPLGENRMKIGFVTKILLDEGKIERKNNHYFPVSDSDQDQSVFIRRDYF
ncbi:MAG: hypothetical protein BWY08_01681 [Bacteroidetes bacterium ADurb.Bin174]|nr:MAG: hypothetical protein BWY08_01681 [Bacteroidetes bacterium ADurb.Bin174]